MNDSSEARTRTRLSSRWRGLLGVAVDIGLPTASYYTARGCSLPDRSALLAAAAVAIGRVGWVAVRNRTVSWVAVLTVITYGLGAVLTLIVTDPRLVLLKESATDAVIGMVFLASTTTATPVTLGLAQAHDPGRAEDLHRSYHADPAVRAHFRRGTAVWGGGFLTDAILRIPLVLALPLDTAVLAGQLLMITTVGLLAAWTQHRRHTSRLQHN